MKEATGIDLADIINAESYDAKVNRNVNVSGLDSVNFVVRMTEQRLRWQKWSRRIVQDR